MTPPGREDQWAVKDGEVPGCIHGSVSRVEQVQETTQQDCSLNSSLNFVVSSKSHQPHLPQMPRTLGVPFLHMLGNVKSNSMIKSSIIYPGYLISLFWREKIPWGWIPHWIYYRLQAIHDPGSSYSFLLERKKYLLFLKSQHSTSQLDSFR